LSQPSVKTISKFENFGELAFKMIETVFEPVKKPSSFERKRSAMASYYEKSHHDIGLD
jgi:hypothetical protein